MNNLVDTFLYRHDPEGIFTYVSSSVTQVLGYSTAEFLTHFGEYMTDHPANQEATRRMEQSMKGIQQPPYDVEIYHKEGGVCWLAVSETPVRDSRGRVVAVEGVAHSITERKQVEAKLNRFALVIEQASESVIITNTTGIITYVNPAFERVTGYTSTEVIGQNPRILKSGEMDEAVYRDLWESITRGDSWSGTLVNKRKDGTLFTEETTISPLRAASGAIASFVAVKRNVTRELELEEQFLQAQKMEAVGQLAGGVAHDFNNLLQVIIGYGYIAQEASDVDSEIYQGLDQVMKAADRATILVQQLLAFSRKQVLKLEVLDLSVLVSDMAKMIQRVLGEHIAFNLLSEPGLKSILADKGQIEQVLMNLCVNARDAMAGGGTLTIETGNIEVDAAFVEANAWAKCGHFVVLSLTDTGCGMDEETQRRIFEPFFTTKGLGKGTGLGLSTVFGITRQHNGMVHVYSEPGTGTTFKVYLPRIEGTEIYDEAIEVIPPRGGTEIILLADDDEGVRNIAKAMLDKAGYIVLTAADGEEAIRVFDEHADEIKLALLDVVMPKLGGKAVFDHIQERSPQTHVLFSSGYSINGIHSNFVLDDGMHLIQKPYQQDALLRRIRDLLDS